MCAVYEDSYRSLLTVIFYFHCNRIDMGRISSKHMSIEQVTLKDNNVFYYLRLGMLYTRTRRM
jgi:hypothetical protein